MCKCGRNHGSDGQQPPWSAYITALLTLAFAGVTVLCFFRLYTAEPENVFTYAIGTGVWLLLTFRVGRTCLKIIRQYNRGLL